MKTIRSLILTLLVVGCSSEPVDGSKEGIHISKLVERNGILYLIAEDETSTNRFTGEAVQFYDNGQLREKETYRDGTKSGPFERYHKNGILKLKGNFKDGEQDGPWKAYNEKGQLEANNTYKEGKLVY